MMGDVESGRHAVIIGEAPALEDVLSGLVKNPPFDLESLRQHFKAALCEETLDFYFEVENYRKLSDVGTYSSETKRMESTFIQTTALRQVNLSSKQRTATEARAAAALTQAAASGSLDLTVFDEAQQAILQMMERDQYATYVNRIVVERNLILAKSVALWWLKLDTLTVKEFFTFPSPVNAAESRLHNLCTCALIISGLALAYYADFIWLLVYMCYGFAARVACGPRLDIQAFIVLFILRPLLADHLHLLKNKFVSSPSKHFAQLCGLVFSALVLGFAAGEIWIAAVVVAAVFLVAAGLAAFADICIACIMFNFAAEKGFLGARACDDCKLTYVAHVRKSSMGAAAKRPKSAAVTSATPAVFDSIALSTQPES